MKEPYGCGYPVWVQIEEAFRLLKSYLHLGSCQQHKPYLFCCAVPKGMLRDVVFACLELVPDLSPYATKQVSFLDNFP